MNEALNSEIAEVMKEDEVDFREAILTVFQDVPLTFDHYYKSNLFFEGRSAYHSDGGVYTIQAAASAGLIDDDDESVDVDEEWNIDCVYFSKIRILDGNGNLFWEGNGEGAEAAENL